MRILFILLVILLSRNAFSAQAAGDAFCRDPHKAICSQKIIRDDLGETFVGDNLIPYRERIRKTLLAEAKSKFQVFLAKDQSGKTLKRYAALTGLNGFAQTSCWSYSWLPSRCRAAVVDLLATQLIYKLYPDSVSTPRSSMRIQANIENDLIFRKTAHEIQARELELTLRNNSTDVANDAFVDLKKIYFKKLDEWKVPEAVRRKKKSLLDQTRFTPGGSQCGTPRSEIYTVNAAYDYASNRLFICNGIFLRTNSPTAISFIVGHELAHALMDTCQMGRDVEKYYGSLLTCLKNQTAKSLSGNCSNTDPRNELFADWVSTEALVEYVEKKYPREPGVSARNRFAAALAPLCGTGNLMLDAHPLAKERINNILFQNPRVRQLSGCTAVTNPIRYCSIQSVQRAGSGNESRVQSKPNGAQK